MLLRTGRHVLKRDDEPGRPVVVDYAEASTPIPSTIFVWLRGQQIVESYVGTYSPHTWWGNNPLLGREELRPGEEIVIEVGLGAVLRLEGNLVYVRELAHR